MKIMIILPAFRTGGGEQLALDEAIGLKNKDNIKITLVSIAKEEDTIFRQKAKDNHINTIFLDKKDGFSVITIVKLIFLIKKEKPDVVHTHLGAFPYTVIASIFFTKIRFYHTLHNIAQREAVGIKRKLANIVYKNKKFTPIAISDYCAKTIEQVYGLNVDNIPVVYNGIDTKRFECKVEYTERNTSSIKFITTGRFENVKRHNLMIDCFFEVQKKYLNCELVLLGDGILRDSIEMKINDYNIQSKVIFKGIVSNVEEELNNANIYLMASDFEGLPLSVLEAMSCGLPVIATKAGGTVDIVNDDVGILCDVDNKQHIIDAMLKLLNDDLLRKKMSINAIKNAKNYDAEKCVNDYYNLFMN